MHDVYYKWYDKDHQQLVGKLACPIRSSVASSDVLTHRIRISEILPWDRKSYLTHAILPRLSRDGYIHWLFWNSRTWSSSDIIVMLK